MGAENRTCEFQAPVLARARRGAGAAAHGGAQPSSVARRQLHGQVEAWDDAARLADNKWDRVMGEVWPEAQAHVAGELGSGDARRHRVRRQHPRFPHPPGRRCAARRSGGALRVLMSDGEFHSARRQFARWAEDGWLAAGAGRRRAPRRFFRALSRCRAQWRPRPDPRQPDPVRQRPPVRRGRRARQPRAAGRPVGGDRRLSCLHGDRGGPSRRPPRQCLLPRRRL